MPKPRKPKVTKAIPFKATKTKPSDLISTSAVTCENVLMESDGVMSAIRLVDIFFFVKIPELPIEKQAVLMRVLVMCKFRPGADPIDHAIQLFLIRPDGETTAMGEPQKGNPISTKYPEAPGGVVMIAQVGIIPKQEGTHYVKVLVDGEEKTRIPVTLLERKTATAD
jgi:hypothetical protein